MNITTQVFESFSVDALWLHKSVNVRYQSGFTGDDTDAFISNGRRCLLTDARYTEQAKAECPDWEAVDHHGKLTDALAACCHRQGIRRLGIEMRAVTAAQYVELQKALPDVELIDADTDRLRQIKTEEEITAIRHACEIGDRALQDILPLIRSGVTEHVLRAELERAMLAHGSEQTAFTTIVASGYRSAMPHGIASDKVVEDGDFITFDFGAVYHGYHSDMTRSFVVGKATERQRHLYHAVLRAQEAACKMIRPGMAGSEPDQTVRDMLKQDGLETYFSHSLGHSVGLEIHEGPNLSPRETRTLAEGMVVTVEPGVYIAGFGGLRIEDTTVVREDGLQLLTQFPKELVEL